MKRTSKFILLILLLVVACGGPSEEEVAATVAASLSATQTAAPTATQPPPTETPTPEPTATNSPTPVPTNTPLPTETPIPTETPEPTATAAPESDIVRNTLASGEILYTNSEAGFTITLPPEWIVVDLDGDDFSEMLGSVADQNESMSFLSRDAIQSMVASGMKFYGLEGSIDSLSSDIPISINIIRQDVPVGLSLEQLATLTASQLESVFDLTSEIEQETVSFGDEEGMMISYTMNLVTAIGVEAEALNTQYFVVRGNDVYIITLGMGIELVGTYLETARAAVETFQITSGD